MSDFVTQVELTEAIAAVTEDIRDTERRLRSEFTAVVRYEGDRTDGHLASQDEKLVWINRWTLGTLVAIIVALIYLVH